MAEQAAVTTTVATSLAQHAAMRAELARSILDLRESALEFGFDAPAALLLRASNRLRSHAFKVLVIGEFSRGKSALINALLGQRLLPSGLRPTTPVITVLASGNSGDSVVRYRDGRTARPSASELTELLSGKATDADSVESVEVRCPHPLLEHGVQIVDTPGVNDVNRLREDVTLRFLPEADAAIFLIDAQAPLSATEKHFLEGEVFRRNIGHVFLVVNKADRLRPPYNADDLTKIVRRVEGLLGSRIAETRVFAVAAKAGLDAALAGDAAAREASRLPTLERALADFLARDRGRVVLQRVVHECQAAVESLDAAARLEIDGLDLSVEDAAAKTTAVTAELDAVRRRLDIAHARWVETVQHVRVTTVARVQAQAAEAVNTVLRALENQPPESYFHRGDEFRAAADAQLREVFTHAVYAARDLVRGDMEREAERLVRETDEIGRSGLTESLGRTTVTVMPAVNLLHPATPLSSPITGRAMGVGAIGMIAASLVMGPVGAVIVGALAGWGQSAWTRSGERSKAAIVEQTRADAQQGLDALQQALTDSVTALAETIWSTTTESLRAQVESLASSAGRVESGSREAQETRTKRAQDLQRLRGDAEAVLTAVRSALASE